MAHSKFFGPILITLVLSSLILCISLVGMSLEDFADDDVINKTALSPTVAGVTVLVIMFGLQFESYNIAAEKPGYTSIFPTFGTVAVFSALWALWVVAMAFELADYIPRTTRTKPYFDYNGGSIDQTFGVVAIQGIQIVLVTSGMIVLALVERKRKPTDDTISMSTLEHPLTRASSNRAPSQNQ
ncbi:hypothetical protein DL96DRAFT_1683087 [Flagelloscypha sp. PMI_526]|nr:hypothetical protein DL96DRAFT_1683087 [Flagelloscypha sp. PMI_526]